MTDKAKLILVECRDYGRETVLNAFARLSGIAASSGIDLPKRSKILMKPNLLAPALPEKAVTTHPEIFRAAARLLKKNGNELYYGDSPGMGEFEKAAQVSGLAKIALEEGVKELNLNTERTVDFPNGHFCKRYIIAGNLDASFSVFNLPKLKTHGQMMYTGAVKNIFGCVPGIRKAEAHMKMFSLDNFSKMIADLYMLIHPVFSVMDAVYAMEGNGPGSGTPRKLGFILAGGDALAIDSICARIIGLDPRSIPLLKYAEEFGAGSTELSDIEIFGDDWEKFIVRDFKNIVTVGALNFLGPGLTRLIKNIVITKPAVNHSKCIRCRKCLEKCPANKKSPAIFMKNNRIEYNYRNCIRCYCCQEICPEGAIFVKEPLLWKLAAMVYNSIKG